MIFFVFPARAGMSLVGMGGTSHYPVFPARAGMSRHRHRLAIACASVPRASGDEPTATKRRVCHSPCSPRERG